MHDRGGSWLVAAALALSSSTDNFAVGLSVELAGHELPRRVNAIIAVCNAFGALLSAAAGQLLSEHAPQLLPSLFAAAIFLYLGYDEFSSWRRGDVTSPLATKAAEGLAWKLALPMTLNNLAGGAAGGAVGIGPAQAFASALFASYLMCTGGSWLGQQVGARLERWLEPRLVAAAIFAGVAGMQMWDMAS